MGRINKRTPPPWYTPLPFEACEPGTAARLRRMERIAKKYKRRCLQMAEYDDAGSVYREVANALSDILSA